MRIQTSFTSFLVLSASVALAASTPTTKARPSAGDGWPAGPAGVRAAGWVAAFNAGPDSMRSFIAAHTAPKELQRRGLPARIETYKALRARLGTLMLTRVIEATPGKVTATLLDAGAVPRTFVFRVELDPPHRLISVGSVERGHGHGGGSHEGGAH